ncbi:MULTISPECIES: Arm DNA-binding domain-containing protein [Alistipes]
MHLTLANGKHPLMLRLTKAGKRKYISLHLSFAPQF